MLEENIDYIKKTADEMIVNIESEIGKEIAINLLPEIVKSVGLQSENQLGRLTNMVRITSNTIKGRIRRNTDTRTINLVNTFNSSYETVNNLNKKTCNMTVGVNNDQVAKLKIKKAA